MNDNTNKDDSIFCREIDIGKIIPGRWQPRKSIDKAYVARLAKTIDLRGLEEPLVVVDLADGRFELVSGENRYWAVKSIGHPVVMCIVRPRLNDEIMLINAVSSNGGAPLTPIEKAEACARLSKTMTHSEIGNHLGEKRVTVTKLLRLLKLPTPVRELIHSGKLSPSHGSEILCLENANLQVSMSQEAAEKEWNVRTLKQKIELNNFNFAKGAGATQDWVELEKIIKEQTGFDAKLRKTKDGFKVSFNLLEKDDVTELMHRLSPSS